MQIGLDNNNNTGDQALLAMADFNWITYLTSNRMPLAIKQALLANPYILEIFGNEKSIATSKRDDFTIASLPAISIYESEENTVSRFYSDRGRIHFNIFLPVRLDREDSTTVLKTVAQAFKNILQSLYFFRDMVDALIPLPPITSPIYNDVFRYKRDIGSPLKEFAKVCQILSPLRSSLTEIGDAWKLEIITDYYFDMLDYYAMLEDFGVEGHIDPNKIVYNVLQDFSVETQPIT